MSSPPPDRRQPARTRRRLLVTALALLGALGLTASACASSDSTASGATTTSSTSTTSTTAVDPGPGPTSLEGVAVRLDPVVPNGLDDPTAMATRPMRNQLWVTERPGRVRIVSVDTTYDRTTGKTKRTGYTLLPGAALDVSSLTTTSGERGLLGLAFSTDGDTLFVDHTLANGDIVVASYQVEDKSEFSGGPGTTPPQASRVAFVDPASRRELLTIPHQENSNHNGGQLLLGPDGYLYIGVGDGGGAGDPKGNGQSTDTLLGKILRVDPAGAALGQAYAVPPSNPFATSGGRPEIYLYGVRNPWRFSFDDATGDLWVADVGQNAVEEVDWLPASSGAGRGANLGWSWFEGDQRFRTDGTPPEGTVKPLLTYGHDGGRCAITGGYVYRGSAVPKLVGTYVYGDYCTGAIRGLLARKGIELDDRPLGPQVPASSLVSFGQDDQGELYVLSSEGSLSRIVAG